MSILNNGEIVRDGKDDYELDDLPVFEAPKEDNIDIKFKKIEKKEDEEKRDNENDLYNLGNDNILDYVEEKGKSL